MVTPLNCREVNSLSFAISMCGRSSLVNYLLSYKLPEDYVVKPTNTAQVVTSSAKNRYIRSVTIQGVSNPLVATPSNTQQVFTNGPYSTVTVEAQA